MVRKILSKIKPYKLEQKITIGSGGIFTYGAITTPDSTDSPLITKLSEAVKNQDFKDYIKGKPKPNCNELYDYINQHQIDTSQQLTENELIRYLDDNQKSVT